MWGSGFLNSAFLKAINLWLDVLGRNTDTCPLPCKKMTVFFGFPVFSTTDDCGIITQGRVHLYFRSMIKVTREHLAYSFLRYFIHLKIKDINYIVFLLAWWQKLVVTMAC